MRYVRALVPALTGWALLVGAVPAVALTAEPPAAVYASTTWRTGSESASVETALEAAFTAAGTGPEVVALLTVAGSTSVSLRADSAGQLLQVGSRTVSGTGSFSASTSPVWVSGVSLDCQQLWSVDVTVLEVSRNAGVIEGLAADWAISCRSSVGDQPLKARTAGSIRYGTSSGSLPYGAPAVAGTWVRPAAIPAGLTLDVDIPITTLGDQVSIAAVAGGSSGFTVSADRCSGETLTSTTSCAVTVTVAPSAGTTAGSLLIVLDLTSTDGRITRVARSVNVRGPLVAPQPMPFPVPGGMGIAVRTDSYPVDVVTVRRRSGDGPWVEVGSVGMAAVDGVGPRVIDRTAVAGEVYEYDTVRRTANGLFESAPSASTVGRRPVSDTVPVERSRLALKSGTTSAPAQVADTGTGLSTSVTTADVGERTEVVFTDGIETWPAALSVRLIPGPGTYTDVWPKANMRLGSRWAVADGPTTLVVRDVQYDENGTLLLLDASMRSFAEEPVAAEIRYRTEGGLAVPVASPASLALVTEPDAGSAPQELVVSNTGVDPMVVGDPVVSGAGASRWSAAGCVSVTLAPGESCTVTLIATGAPVPGVEAATLTYGAAVGSTQVPILVPLALRTSDAASAPRFPSAVALPRRVLVSWTAPLDDGGRPIVGWELQRRPVGTLSWQAVPRVRYTDTYAVDESPLSSSAEYRVAAVTSRGSGTWTEPVSVTAASPAAVAVVGSLQELQADAPWGLYLGRPSIGPLVPLQVDGHEHETPTVAPDASSVIVSRASTPGAGEYDFDLWRVPLEPDSAPSRLTSLPGAEVDPEVSPDGQRVAFTYYPPWGSADLRPQVWTIGVDGTDSRLRLTGFSRPTWETSQRLVTSDDRTSTSPLVRVAVVGAATGVPAPLAGTEGGFDPSVSPSGKDIAFVSGLGRGAALSVGDGSVRTILTVGGDTGLFLPTWINDTVVSYSQVQGYLGWPQPATMTGLGTALGARLAAVPLRDGSAPAIGPTPSYLRTGATLSVPVADPSSPRAGVLVSCRVDGGAARPCLTASGSFGLTVSGLAQGRHTLQVTASDVWGNTSTATRSFVVDDQAPGAPTIRIPRWVRTPSVTVTPAGSADVSPVRYQFRYRTWPIGQRAPNGWQAPTAGATPSYRLTIATRGASCVQARAVDAVGLVGPWSAERCVTRPLDDRDLRALDPGWSRGTDRASYLSTVTSARNAGTRLVSRLHVGASQLVLIASRCSSCGVVGVYHGDVRIAEVNLRSSRARSGVAIVLPRTRYRYAQLELRTRSSAPVRIDGIVPLR